MKIARYLTVLSAAVFPAAFAMLLTGCPKEKDPDPPAPTPVATAAPTPAPVADITPEVDAGADADAGDGFDGHVASGGGGDSTGIRKCCSALRGNMKTAPPEQQAALGMAAGICDGMVNNPQGRSALSSLRGILRGANMPAACQ